ncbi:hypothetical protein [Actinoplanes sp. RD1]|uniref:hypothetical protein n=1 Tax=Actinoplanes sp. RD1 TaxID=3064538 RepID=UPI0027428CD2|nr:hypothetical protein [Actinoplanes sp. RD1]
MNYGFLIYGELDGDRVAQAFAELLSLPADAIDVGIEGDDDRDWSAPVSCTVTPLSGHPRWHMDVYLSRAVPSPPPVAIVAARLAARLGTAIAYAAAPSPPSAYWLVGPDARRTRARIYEEDADGAPAYRIDAVEHAVAAVPGLTVAPLPEVIRGHRMPTPATDALREALAEQRELVSRLGAWEAMVSRLVEGWPPDGWYPAEYYREDLATRDELAALSQFSGESVKQAIEQVDRRFAEATEDDGGRALVAETGALPAGGEDHWWWHRVPRPLPWAGR